MNKCDRKKMIDLIRADLIAMNGGKNNMRADMALLVLFFGGLGFGISPIMGLSVPFLVGVSFVPMLFQNELKYHSERTYALLPIERKDLVRSRFLMFVGLYVMVSLFFYLLMLLSMKLKLYHLILGEKEDILKLLAQGIGSMTELDLFNLLYFGAFSLGLMFLSGSLRKYFRNSNAYDTTLAGRVHKLEKKELAYLLLISGAILLGMLIVSGVLPIGDAAAVTFLFVESLAAAANGFLLGAVLLVMAVFSVWHKYVCAVLEYDEKEL